jgi:hypothetical protein
LASEKDEFFAAERNRIDQDREEVLNTFTKAKQAELAEKDRLHGEAIKHHQGLFAEMEAKLTGEIADKMNEMNDLIIKHQGNIVSITNAKNADIEAEQNRHAETKQILSSEISQLTGDLSTANAKIAVRPPLSLLTDVG